MKRNLYIFNLVVIISFFLGITNSNIGQTLKQDQNPGDNLINIYCSNDINTLTLNWIAEYGKINPSAKISVNVLNNNQNFASNELCFITEDQNKITSDEKWKIILGHDALVPVINTKNPFISQLYSQGLSPSTLGLLLKNTNEPGGSELVKNWVNAPLHIYLIDNASDMNSIADFLKIDHKEIKGTMKFSSEEVLAAVQQDIYAIGFCKLKDLRKPNSNEWVNNISVLPIDKNENGRLDKFENIYTNPDAFARAIWIGKYPSALSQNIYAVSTSKPENQAALNFLVWILNSGGYALNSNGFSDLASVEKRENLDMILGQEVNLINSDNSNASYAWIYLFAGILIIGLLFILILRKYFTTNNQTITEQIHITPVLNENTIHAPKGLYFDRTHTWSFMEKDGLVRVGIDDFLQHLTGTLTRVKLKEPGEFVRKGDKIMSIIRLGKQLDIYSPISGIIKENNAALIHHAPLLNSATYTHGWVYTIEPKNWTREIQFLFMSDRYKEWLRDEFVRLKDFFAFAVKSNTSVYEQVILQDGGELADKILADMGPEVWEDFQIKFLDSSR